MRHVQSARKWYIGHKRHVIASMSFVAVITHYFLPSYDAHVTALIGFVCVELA
jgi:hypothetical protein